MSSMLVALAGWRCQPFREERDRLLVQGAFIALRGSDNLVSEQKWRGATGVMARLY